VFTTIVATETSITHHVQDIITISASTTTTITSSSSNIDATSFFDSIPPPLSLSSSSSSNDNTSPSRTSSDFNPSADNNISHVGTTSMMSSVDLITRSKAICTAVTIQSKQLESTQNSTIGMMMMMMMMVKMFIMMMGDSDDVMMAIVIVTLYNIFDYKYRDPFTYNTGMLMMRMRLVVMSMH